MPLLSRSESERPYVYPTLSDSLSADAYKLQQWLSEHSLQHIFPEIQRLGYDSIDLFVECDDDNICQIDDDIRRNTALSIPERLKFKKAIRSLKNARKGRPSRHQRDRHPLPTTISTDEAIVRLASSMDRVSQLLSELEQQQQSQADSITFKFSMLFQQLQESREALLKSLRSECQQKQTPLQGVLSRLQRMRDEASASRSRVMDLRSISGVEREIAALSGSSAPAMNPLPSGMAIRVDFTTDRVDVSLVDGDADGAADEQNMHDREEQPDIAFVGNDDEDDLELSLSDLDIDEQREEEELKMIELEVAALNCRRPLRRAFSEVIQPSQLPCSRRHGGHSRMAMSDPSTWRNRRYSAVSPSARRLQLQHQRSVPMLKQRYKSRSRQKRDIVDSDEWAETIVSGATGRSGDGIESRRRKAFGRRLVFDGLHFWRLRVKDPMGDYDGRGVSVGFVSEQDQSVWLRCDGAVRVNGKRRGSVSGLVMRHRDTLSVCLDLEEWALFVQRIEWKSANRSKVHAVKRLSLRGMGLQLNRGEGWRLGSILRMQSQAVMIGAYSGEPFDEWQWP